MPRTIIIDLFYAANHGERFTEDALAKFGNDKSAFNHAAAIRMFHPVELGTNEDMALALAEEVFTLTNTTPWWSNENVFRKNEDIDPYLVRRSMCVGDVLTITFPDDTCVHVGCCSVGFKLMERTA